MKKILFSIVFLLPLCVAALLAVDAHQFLNSPLSEPAENFELEVKPGTTIRSLASTLNANNKLKRPLWWEAYARYTGEARTIKTGEYTLSTSLTPMALLTTLQKSQQKQYSLTLLEGWNIWQVRDALAKDAVLEQTIAAVSDSDLMAFIGAEAGHPEGQFLPDTYLFPKGTTDAEFLLRAHRQLQSTLAAAWEERDEGLPVTSPYEVLIQASIIEKETSVESERETISGVIVNRLRKKMRLQMDPTVIYGIGKDFNGNITRKDLQTKTPYNTYTIPALPPTPIAMASAASIFAAVHPQETKALFFVADGTGGHVFNETVEEHNKAVRKYILKKK